MCYQRIIGREQQVSIRRFMPFGDDESKFIKVENNKVIIQRPLPWYKPFNINLHWWWKGDGDTYHDHPRWSITIVLKGKMVEHTFWSKKLLSPGSIVFRNRKYAHRFTIPEGYEGKTWTLFIVGRWKHPQNEYKLKNLYGDWEQ